MRSLTSQWRVSLAENRALRGVESLIPLTLWGVRSAERFEFVARE
jgi:hypothetical protein